MVHERPECCWQLIGLAMRLVYHPHAAQFHFILAAWLKCYNFLLLLLNLLLKVSILVYVNLLALLYLGLSLFVLQLQLHFSNLVLFDMLDDVLRSRLILLTPSKEAVPHVLAGERRLRVRS